MRDYGKVAPQFWTGKTGKALRGNMEAQIVAMYLMTSPHANMIGVYHLPMLYLSHETGMTPEGASKGLAACVECGFCHYDDESETVFVVEMAAHQVGETLKETDNRSKPIDRLFRGIASPDISTAFLARYGEAFNLSKAPPKGLTKGLPKPPYPVTAPVTAPVPDGGAGETSDPLSGVDGQIATDFRRLRDKLKAPITPTAIAGIRREADKANLTLDAALAMCCERGWRGFKAEWVLGAAAPVGSAKKRVQL